MRTWRLIQISLLALIFLIFSFWLHLHQRETKKATPPEEDSAKTLETSSANLQTDPSLPNANSGVTSSATSTEQEFLQQLKTQSTKVGEVNADPSATERELDRWANSLSEKQLKILQQNILNPSIAADERSLSVYLLSLSQSPFALAPLQDVVLTPLPATQNDRSLLFEEVLRVQAIEGLLRQTNTEQVRQTLLSLKQKTDSNFLQDQAQRGLAFLNGEAEHPTEQSHKALQNLLNKTRSHE